MNFKPLKIGQLTASLPIIQGGMGVGVSLSNLSSAVTNAGGIGVISSAQIGFREPDFLKNSLECNLRALKKEIKLAKDKCKNGILGLNVMVATTGYVETIKTAIESGIDIIISGAGLPTNLPEIVKGSNVKIAPIVSSLKATKVILKLWDKHHNTTADMVIIEGPLAGGHLGFKKEDLQSEIENFDITIQSIIEEVKKYEELYSKEIPVIVAGGVFTGYDIAKYLKLGANGVQMATRFVATEECDASRDFKEAYVNCSKEDITIVSSPVGMPGRAISNEFIEKRKKEKEKITHCYNCLSPCNPKDTPYCISKALINTYNGNLNDGLLFCGANAYKINEITTVPKLMEELKMELMDA